ncbi:hypothetical protein A2U01_0116362, partial [Trifolium medium]|nr:hypothetical protein [Trifolium medium]
ITTLCRAKDVPEYPEDERLFSIKALLVSQYRGYISEAGHPQAAGADENGGESADEMNQFED